MDKISDCNRGYEEEKDKQVDSTESNPERGEGWVRSSYKGRIPEAKPE